MVGCFSPLILGNLGSKLGQSGCVQVYSFLIWKTGKITGKIGTKDFLFQYWNDILYLMNNQLLFKDCHS